MRENIILEKIGPKLWRVVEQYREVPPGFITDGASVPKCFHNILSPMTGPHAEAAVIHDYHYSLDSGFKRDQKSADKSFLKNMLDNGVWKHRAYSAYYTVRAFGRFSYKKKYSVDKMKGAY